MNVRGAVYTFCIFFFFISNGEGASVSAWLSPAGGSKVTVGCSVTGDTCTEAWKCEGCCGVGCPAGECHCYCGSRDKSVCSIDTNCCLPDQEVCGCVNNNKRTLDTCFNEEGQLIDRYCFSARSLINIEGEGCGCQWEEWDTVCVDVYKVPTPPPNVSIDYDSNRNSIRIRVSEAMKGLSQSPFLLSYDLGGLPSGVTPKRWKEENDDVWEFSITGCPREGVYTVRSTGRQCMMDNTAEAKIFVKGDPIIYIGEGRERSVVNPDGFKVTIRDFDDPLTDTAPDIPNSEPSPFLHKIIERGFTLDENDSPVPYEYITRYEYDEKGHLYKAIDPMGNTTIYDYSRVERRCRSERFCSCWPLILCILFPTHCWWTRTVCEEEVELTDNLQRVIDPLGHITYYYDYDDKGNPQRIVDPNGNTTLYTYTYPNNLTRVSSITQVGAGPDGEDVITRFYYTSWGDIDYVILPMGDVIDYSYKYIYNQWRLVEISHKPSLSSSPLETIKYFYDSYGNKIREEVRDERGILRRFQDILPGTRPRFFNPDYSPTPESYNSNTPVYTEILYDSYGNKLWMKDENDNITYYSYNQRGNLTSVKQPGNKITNYFYDYQGNLTAVIDANGNITNYLYDDMGRIVKSISPDTGETNYRYDPNGNLIYKMDANGNVFIYTYDPLNRLTSIISLSNSNKVLVRYFYDGNNPHGYTIQSGIGRLTGIEDSISKTSYFYDRRGNITKEVKTISEKTFITYYFYDLNGNIEKIIYPSGRVIEYTNYMGRAKEVKATINGNLSTIAYDIKYEPFGDIKDIRYGNGVITTISYNYRGLVKEISSSVLSLNYTYDRAGNIINKNNEGYGYDQLNMLVSAKDGYGELYYGYDSAGNRLSFSRGNKETTYNYEKGTNRLISYKDPLRAWAFVPNEGGSPQGRYEKTVQDIKKEVFDICGEGFGKSKVQVEKSFVEFLFDVNKMINENGLPEVGITRGILFRLWLKEKSMRGYIKEIAKSIDGLIDEERCNLLKGFIKEAERLNIFKLLEQGTDVSYDANGNVISITDNGEGDFYEYDEFNRIKRVVSYGIVIGEYFYDSMNRRVLKRSFGQEIIYLYDIFGNLISEVDSKTGNLIRDYIYVGSRPIVMVHYTPPPEQPPPPSSGCSFSRNNSILQTIFIISLFLTFLYITRKRKSLFIFILLCGILSMMCLEEEKDYMGENVQNPEPCEPLDEPVQNFEKPETPQDPIEPFIIHTNPGKENLYYYHLDHLGTPLKLTDENGNVVWSINCSPFQEICSISGDIIQPLRFLGQYYDEETGLHYNWHRYYKPDWGRYVEPEMFTYGELKTNSILNGEVLQYLRNQEIFLINNFRPMYIFSLSSKNLIWNTPPGGKVLLDSLLEEYIKIPQAINLYSYSLNNPLIYTDPSGVYLGKSTINICKSLSQGECGYVASFLTAYITSFGSYRGCFIKICRKKCVSVPSCTSELYCGEIYPPG